MKTKLFSFFLALTVSIGTAFAVSGTCGDSLSWDLADSKLIIHGSGPMSNYSSSLQVPWYSVCESIKEIIISHGVSSIGKYAFAGCSGLTNITIPNSVISIGMYAFSKCYSLTSVTIPNTVTSIGYGAFYDCTGLTSITIPNSVKSIGNYAFEGCISLSTIAIGNGVTSIGNDVFAYCASLTSIVVENGNSVYDSRNNCNAIIQTATNMLVAGCLNTTIPNSVTSIGNGAFYNCTGLTSITIPNSVTSIGRDAFFGCTGLTIVKIPNSVTNIGYTAFAYCASLTSIVVENGNSVYDSRNNCNAIIQTATNMLVAGCLNTTIPNSVTSIGNGAFYDCTGLTSITIPNSVTSIEEDAFYYCIGLTSVTLNSNNLVSKTYTSKNNFKSLFGSQVTEYIIGGEITSVGNYAFGNCSNLRSLTIGNGVTSIGKYAFNGCTGLTSVTLNSNNLVSKTYTYDDNLKAIFGSQVKEYIIGSEITSIGDCAFFGCTNLTGIIIPSSITSIGTEAFYGCSSNKAVINHSSLNIVKGSTSHGYVAYYASDVYFETDTIGEFVFAKSGNKDYVVSYLGHDCQITLPANYRGNSYGIGVNLFRNNTTTNSITISNAITSIGDYSFSGCSNLNVVYVGNSVVSIGQEAFYDCPVLYKIIMLPNSVPSGINSAFKTLSGRITYVGNTNYQSGYDVLGTQRVYTNLNSYFSVDGIVYALVNPGKRICDIIDCDYSGATKEISIGNSVVYRKVTLTIDSININAFRNNDKITKMVVDCNHSLPSEMASGCSSIDTLIIKSNVGNIGPNAFTNSSKKTNAYYFINNSGNISSSAFVNCSKLHNLIIADSVNNIGISAFYNCVGIAKADISNTGNIESEAFRAASMKDNATYHIHNKGSIGQYAFSDCSSMKSLIIDTCVSYINQYAFYNCSKLEDVTIKNKSNIGEHAFDHSSTQNPANYIISNRGSIGDYAFAYCSSMKSLVIDTCVSYINQYAFRECYNLEDVTIINKGYIGKNAFYKSSTQNPASYIISNVGSIGDDAFSGCTSLHKVRLGNRISSIGGGAFYNCVSLDSITLPNSVTTVGDSAFYNCYNLAYVNLNDRISSVGKSVFANCRSLPKIVIPSSVNSIGGSTFQGCTSLAVVSFEDGKTSLSLGRHSANKGLFYDCPLDSVYIGRGLSYPNTASDGYSPFYRSATLRSIVLSDFPTKVETNEFYGCTKLNYVLIGHGVKSIGDYAFSGCSSIDYFSFGEKVQSIGAEAFSDCVAMTRLYSYCPQPPSCGASALEDIDKWSCTLYIPKGTMDLYQAADQWRDFFFMEESAIMHYTISVNFDSTQGNVTGAGVYERGSEAVLTAMPAEGYVFVKWEDGSTDPVRHISVYQSATYSAIFSAVYTITFKNGDEVLQSIKVAYGIVPTYDGGTPTKPATAQYTYTFAGWKPEVVAVTGDAIYTADFDSVVNKYTITFLNEDGTVLSSQQWNYGATPTCNEPTKPATAQYTYAFAGWTPEVVQVTGNATYTATYTSTLRKYTITFLDEDGTVLSSQQWNYGATPTCDEPTKPATAQYTYTFAGWTPSVVFVTGDATYQATYTATKNSYTITWKQDDGTTIDQTTVEYGQIPAHADPTKPGTAEYTYTFAGWSPSVVSVTGDATYQAMFNATKNSYTITWKQDDGTTIDQTTVEYGQIPAHAYPTKPATAQYTYTFAGWTPEVTQVTGAATYTATYTSSLRKYAITFLDDNGSVLSSQQWNYGATPTCDEPTKPATAQYTYTFAGWTPEVTQVTANATYTATYSSTLNKYDITFEVKGDPTRSQTIADVPYGTLISSLVEQVKEALGGDTFEDDQYIYTYVGLENVESTDIVTADATYYVLYSKTEKPTTSLNNVEYTDPARKLYINGVLYIEHNGLLFNAQGARVK